MKPRPYFDDQHNVLPFDKVLELEKIDDRTFRSVVKAYSPTGGENGTYGGHVYAQAAWAAAQTVDQGFLIHVRRDALDFHSNTLTKSRISQAGSPLAEDQVNTSSTRCTRFAMDTTIVRAL
jgi:hypothetical protein